MVSDKFKQYVAEGRKTAVRVYLQNYLAVDENFRQFDEALEYAKKHGINPFVPHDGKTFKSQSEWNKAYLQEVLADMRVNFSQERIDFLRKLMPYVVGSTQTVAKKASAKSRNRNVSPNHKARQSRIQNEESDCLEKIRKWIGKRVYEFLENQNSKQDR